MTSRRAFLAGLAAAALPCPSWADAGYPGYLAAGKNGNSYVLHGIDQGGHSVFRIPLPSRGHAATAHPQRPEAVAFARRPGVFALVIDCATGKVLHELTPPEGRQFNGHGTFSADGSLLMTSEVVAEGSAGRIGLWDGRSYRRLGEWHSHGIGPHDIRLRADGTLIVANGGIQTDPSDRTKLNINTMRPNLALLSADGRLIDSAELGPDLHQNSIRHLAPLGEAVAFAMQWEGDAAEPVPQLGLWTPGKPPALCPAPQAESFAMKGYAGSIAAANGRIALTSPKGGVVQVFDNSGQHLATHRRADLAGIAPAKGGFLASDGLGALWQITDQGLTPVRTEGPLWDNHLVAINT